jgi:hypothetical protein
MQAPITAAEPLDEPPGVRPRSNGLVVGHGNATPISVVTVLPRIAAPASRAQPGSMEWLEAQEKKV